MAVTLTIAQLSAAVRLGDSAEELAEITRLHAYAVEAVEKYAPDAPETTANEAVVRLAAQMFDQPIGKSWSLRQRAKELRRGPYPDAVPYPSRW